MILMFLATLRLVYVVAIASSNTSSEYKKEALKEVYKPL